MVLAGSKAKRLSSVNHIAKKFIIIIIIINIIVSKGRRFTIKNFLLNLRNSFSEKIYKIHKETHVNEPFLCQTADLQGLIVDGAK